jgi:hypothetical protein
MVEEPIVDILNSEDKPAKKKVGRPSKPKEPKEPKEPRVKKTDDPDYFKNYYKEKMLTCLTCPMCDKIMTSAYSLRKHLKNSNYCMQYNIKRMHVINNKLIEVHRTTLLTSDSETETPVTRNG